MKEINLNLDAFCGVFDEYQPTIEHYDLNKVGYGIWDFSIKFSRDSAPIATFHSIYRNGFIDFLKYHGFYKRYRHDSTYFLLQCTENKIEEIEPIVISDFITDYLEKEGKNISFEHKIEGKPVIFTASLQLQRETIKKQCHTLFNKKFLELLPTFETEILKDTPTECYKPFRNKICKITAKGFELINYKELRGKCVWKKHLIDFDFKHVSNSQKCHFYHFIRNVSNAEEDSDRFRSFITSIGYLLHNYNAPEKGQAIILYDEVITDLNKPQGGTGKGVFAKALGFVSEMVKIDGKKFDEDDRFCFQRVCDSTQIVFFDDIKMKLGFDRFNSLLTDGWNIEKKNKDEFGIEPEDSPKVLMSSNSILECEGTTRKRRQSILEFSNHYSKHIIKGNEEPIKDKHGCIFFSKDWDEAEWQKFFSFIIDCIYGYMKNGLHYYEPKNVKANRLRQVTNDDFSEWIATQMFDLNRTYEIKPHYENFRETYYPAEVFSQRKFTGFLKKYAAINDWGFNQPPASSGKTFFQFLE